MILFSQHFVAIHPFQVSIDKGHIQNVPNVIQIFLNSHKHTPDIIHVIFFIESILEDGAQVVNIVGNPIHCYRKK